MWQQSQHSLAVAHNRFPPYPNLAVPNIMSVPIFPQAEEFYSCTFGSKKMQKIEMPLAVPWSWTAAPIGSSWSSAWCSPPSSTQCSRPMPPSTGGESDAGIENGTSSTRTDAWNLHRIQPCHHIALLTACPLQNLPHQNSPLGLTMAHLAPTFPSVWRGMPGRCNFWADRDTLRLHWFTVCRSCGWAWAFNLDLLLQSTPDISGHCPTFCHPAPQS